MPRNPVGLSLPPSEYDEEFIEASTNSFNVNLELIDHVILNELANQKRAPNRLIETHAVNEKKLTTQLKPQAQFKSSNHTDTEQKH